MVLPQSDSETSQGSFSNDDAIESRSLEAIGRDLGLGQRAQTYFTVVATNWQKNLDMTPTSAELEALAEVCRKGVRDAVGATAFSFVMFSTLPFQIPALRRYMDGLPDNYLSKSFPAKSKMNIWMRRTPVLMPSLLVASLLAAPTGVAIAQISFGVRVYKEDRLSRVKEAMLKLKDERVKEIAKKRSGAVPASNWPSQQKQMPKSTPQMATESSSITSDWPSSTQSSTEIGNESNWGNMADTSFDTKSLESPSPTPSWESTFDNDDDASPVAPLQKSSSSSHGQSEQHQQAMSWDEIRRRAATSNPSSSAGNPRGGWQR